MFYSFFLTSKRKGWSVFVLGRVICTIQESHLLCRNTASPSVSCHSCIHSFPYSMIITLVHKQQVAARMSQEWRQSGPTGRLPNPL